MKVDHLMHDGGVLQNGVQTKDHEKGYSNDILHDVMIYMVCYMIYMIEYDMICDMI